MLDFTYPAPVLRQEAGLGQHYLPVPAEFAVAYRDAGIRRLIATLDGHPIRRALMNTRDGEFYILVSLSHLRTLRADYGHTVTVSLAPDPEPDRIELGDEFTAVLEADEEAATRFYSFTPGRQRSLAYYVTSARREETRIKRALEIAHKLRTHTLYGDARPDA